MAQAGSNASPGQPRGAWSYRTVTRPVRDTLRHYRVVRRLSAVLDVILGPLALVAIGLLIVELLVSLSPAWSTLVYRAQLAIWVVFIVAFVVELTLAPKKLLYVRRNWLLVLALALPALRMLRFLGSLRFLRGTRAVRGTNVLRGFTSLNRAARAVQEFLGFSQFAYLAALTVIVLLAATGLIYYLESGTESGIDSVGDALWWSAAVLTTVSSTEDPVTSEGRFVAVAVRIFAVAISGYFTARLAAFFLGGRHEGPAADASDVQALRREIAALRRELRPERERDDGA